MAPDSQKKVDESWKNFVEKEKTSSAPVEGRTEAPPVDFLGFVSTLALQVLMFLGEMPHPETGQAEKNLPQARYLIDVLGVLADKTKGNLSSEEMDVLKNLLYELQLKFVKNSQEPA